MGILGIKIHALSGALQKIKRCNTNISLTWTVPSIAMAAPEPVHVSPSPGDVVSELLGGVNLLTRMLKQNVQLLL